MPRIEPFEQYPDRYDRWFVESNPIRPGETVRRPW